MSRIRSDQLMGPKILQYLFISASKWTVNKWKNMETREKGL